MQKHFSLVLIVLLAITTMTFGQKPIKKGKKSSEQIAQKKTDKMAEVMGLDESLKSSVYDINLKAAQDLVDIKKKIKAEYPDKASRKVNRDKIKATYGPEQKEVRKQRREALKTTGITKAQWKKWKEHKKSQKASKGKEQDLDMNLED